MVQLRHPNSLTAKILTSNRTNATTSTPKTKKTCSDWESHENFISSSLLLYLGKKEVEFSQNFIRLFATLVQKKHSLQDFCETACKILRDHALFFQESCQKLNILQESCKIHKILVWILQETNASCKDLARNILFVQRKFAFCRFFPIPPTDDSSCGNEGFKLLMFKVDLKIQSLKICLDMIKGALKSLRVKII